jgi:hypothetical protein
MFSEVFFTGLYSSLIALILGLVASCYKSKCSKIEFCGVSIIRDVQIEEELDIQQPRNPLQSNNNL